MPYHSTEVGIVRPSTVGSGSSSRASSSTSRLALHRPTRLPWELPPSSQQCKRYSQEIHEALRYGSSMRQRRNAAVMAAGMGDSTSLNRLINEFNVPVNAIIPGHRCTALHAAVAFSQPNCVEILLSNGADASIRDNTGMSALDVATDSSLDTAHDQVVYKMLTEKNSKIAETGSSPSSSSSSSSFSSSSSSSSFSPSSFSPSSSSSSFDSYKDNCHAFASTRDNTAALSTRAGQEDRNSPSNVSWKEGGDAHRRHASSEDPPKSSSSSSSSSSSRLNSVDEISPLSPLSAAGSGRSRSPLIIHSDQKRQGRASSTARRVSNLLNPGTMMNQGGAW